MVRRIRWYTLQQVITVLGMQERAFRRNLKNGTFPSGIVRPGERVRKWDTEDVRHMQYRMKEWDRFVAAPKEQPTAAKNQ